MSLFRSVGARLALALALVVAGALAVVWVALVPSLDRRLVAGRLVELGASARAIVRDAPPVVDQNFVDEAARTTRARVVYFQPIEGGTQTALLPELESSHLAYTAGIVGDPVALRAASAGGLRTGRVSRGDQDYAEAAVIDAHGNVFLFSAPLHDTIEDVTLVRRRLLWAGLVALGLALAAGAAAASLFARRIRRLERAADRIAAGDFEQPIEDSGADEVGELARALDRMRSRLAGLDNARREFIANASHELRTPIFSLGGFLELLQDEDLSDETRREFLATMSEQVGRLSKLATDLLDLSRLDSGPMRLDTETVRLDEVAEDLREEFAAVALREQHPLTVEVDGEGAVLADRSRVLQIGRALVDNALLHTPVGTPVRIVAGSTTLSIEDDGPGIPAAYQEDVFARFTRLDGSRASGTGLGLAIARELAVRMNGAVELESRPGRTVFVLRLPPFRAAAPAGSTDENASERRPPVAVR